MLFLGRPDLVINHPLLCLFGSRQTMRCISARTGLPTAASAPTPPTPRAASGSAVPSGACRSPTLCGHQASPAPHQGTSPLRASGTCRGRAPWVCSTPAPHPGRPHCPPGARRSLTLLLQGGGVQLQVVQPEAGPGRAPRVGELRPAAPAPQPHRAVVVLGDDGTAAAACGAAGQGGPAPGGSGRTPFSYPGTALSRRPQAALGPARPILSLRPDDPGIVFRTMATQAAPGLPWLGGTQTPHPHPPKAWPSPQPGADARAKDRGSHSPMVRLGMLARMRSVAVLCTTAPSGPRRAWRSLSAEHEGLSRGLGDTAGQQSPPPRPHPHPRPAEGPAPWPHQPSTPAWDGQAHLRRSGRGRPAPGAAAPAPPPPRTGSAPGGAGGRSGASRPRRRSWENRAGVRRQLAQAGPAACPSTRPRPRRPLPGRGANTPVLPPASPGARTPGPPGSQGH